MSGKVTPNKGTNHSGDSVDSGHFGNWFTYLFYIVLAGALRIGMLWEVDDYLRVIEY